MFAEDPETDELLREATRYSDAKDMDKAIECLRQANTRMSISPVSYSIQTWLRLPLYLQKAGYFDEAMLEFNKLIDETPDRIARHFSHQSKAVQRKFMTQGLSTIEEKINLAKKREAKRKAKK